MQKAIKRIMVHLLSVLMILPVGGIGLTAFNAIAPLEVNAETTTGILVLADSYSQDYFAFRKDGGNEWEGSDAQQWCIDFFNGRVDMDYKMLDNAARRKIVGVKTNEGNEQYTEEGITYYKGCDIDGTRNGSDASKDKVFFLSGKEFWTYNGNRADDEGNITYNDQWWLRSPGAYPGNLVGAVGDFGTLSDYANKAVSRAHPALYLDSSLFTQKDDIGWNLDGGGSASADNVTAGDKVTFAGLTWTVLDPEPTEAVAYAADEGTILYSGVCGENLTYTMSADGILTISGTGGMSEYDDQFHDDNNIEQIVIEEGVTDISGEAFYGCSNLEKVYLPTSLKKIDYWAFDDCSSLADVFYPGSFEQWRNIEISDNNIRNAALHLYYGTAKQDYLVIVYYLNGGTVSGESEVRVEEIANITKDLDLPDAVKSGCTFDGWADRSTGELITKVKAGTKGTMTLDAEWSDNSGSIRKVVAALDVPTAVKGKAYSADPFTFADDGDNYEVVYHCREVEAPYYSRGAKTPYELVTEKDGLSFAKDGKISGKATSDDKWLELVAGIVMKAPNSTITGYTEYKLWIHIEKDPEQYSIPSNVSEIDTTNTEGSDWYDCVTESDNWWMPFFRYTVPAGQKKWVKIRVASSQLYIETNWGKVKGAVVGEDGFIKTSYDGDVGLGLYRANPGKTYYVYVDNSNNSDDEYVYLSDIDSNVNADGNLGEWSYVKTKSNTDNPLDKSNKKWKKYTVGSINEWNDFFNIKGFNHYGWMYYKCSLDVISPVQVYLTNPRMDRNFGSNYSVYRNDFLSESENSMSLSNGESHYKVNYIIDIADRDYTTDRKYRFNMDVYVPEGYVLYRGDDDYIHVKEGSDDEVAEQCAHDMVVHAEKAATTKEDGNIEYWECMVCGKFFKDAEGKIEIKKEDTIVPKLTEDSKQPTDPKDNTSDNPQDNGQNPSGQTDAEKAAVAKENLITAVAYAKSIEQGNYTDESYKALQDAIAEAEALSKDERATAEQLKAATDKVEAARKALKTKTDPAEQKGEDGTALGAGASAEAAEAAIAGMTSDDDLPGAVFGKLQLKSSKQTNTSVTIAWKKVSGAKKYVIYGNKCGKKNKMKRLATSTRKTKKFTKVFGKKVKKGTYYKFMVVALDENNNVVSSSKIIHVATKGGKVGNVGKVTTKAKKNKVSIKKGKTFKLKAKQVAAVKKLKVKKHRVLQYETTNKKIATVSSKGVIKGKKKGTCYVYVYAQNGVFAKIKVTVR